MIHLAIAGSGGMAHYHVKKFSQIPSCTISACKDHIASHARSFADQYGIPRWYGTIEELIADETVDALSIAVIDWRHAELCRAAIEAGLSVFCEKPMTRTLAEAVQLSQLARHSSHTTYVNFSKRGAKALHAMKLLLERGELGEIQSVKASYRQGWVATGAWGDWRVDPRWKWRLTGKHCTGGVVGDLGSHVVDALLFLFSDLNIGNITRGVNMKDAVQQHLFSCPPEFLEDGGVWLDIAAEGKLNGNIPCLLDISTIDTDAVDDFTITVTSEKRTAVLDLRRSRTSIEVTEIDTGIQRTVQGPEILSTYEHFCQLADRGESTFSSPVPDFAYGLRVQRILDSLAPGGLPL